MDIYDLMYLYFPRRKAIINRVREMDRISQEEAKTKAADNKYVSKGTAGDILSTADIIIPLSWIGDNKPDKIIMEIDNLRNVVEGIGKVKYEENGVNKMCAEPALIFDWFPFTLSNAALQLYSDFVMKLIGKICRNENLLMP